MTPSNAHWNTIFSNKADSELGWYERDVSQTLRFLDQVPAGQGRRVFLPGAGTSLLVEALLARRHELVLNDISDEALNKLRERIGQHDGITWLHHDISLPLPPGLPAVDVWLDRAVLHFLLEEAAIGGYFANLRALVRPGGHVLLAEFSTTGAPKCAGLSVHRYSLREMRDRLGTGFECVSDETYTHITPSGGERPYLYALFIRRDGP